MTEFSVRLRLHGTPLAVAQGDTTLDYVDLVRVWKLEPGDTIDVTVDNHEASSLTFFLTADVVRIS